MQVRHIGRGIKGFYRIGRYTIEWQLDGSRHFIITFTDLHSHFACAWATNSHASLAAAQFFRLIETIFLYHIETVRQWQ